MVIYFVLQGTLAWVSVSIPSTVESDFLSHHPVSAGLSGVRAGRGTGPIKPSRNRSLSVAPLHRSSGTAPNTAKTSGIFPVNLVTKGYLSRLKIVLFWTVGRRVFGSRPLKERSEGFGKRVRVRSRGALDKKISETQDAALGQEKQPLT